MAGDTRDTGPVSSSAFGLCAACAHQRVVGNTRGSTFSLCGLSRVDDRFPRYPRMPVGSCPGFRPREDGSDDEARRPRPGDETPSVPREGAAGQPASTATHPRQDDR